MKTSFVSVDVKVNVVSLPCSARSQRMYFAKASCALSAAVSAIGGAVGCGCGVDVAVAMRIAAAAATAVALSVTLVIVFMSMSFVCVCVRLSIPTLYPTQVVRCSDICHDSGMTYVMSHRPIGGAHMSESYHAIGSQIVIDVMYRGDISHLTGCQVSFVMSYSDICHLTAQMC